MGEGGVLLGLSSLPLPLPLPLSLSLSLSLLLVLVLVLELELEHFYFTLLMIIWKHVTLGLGGEGGGKPRTPPPFLSTGASLTLKLGYQDQEEKEDFCLQNHNVNCV